MEEKDIKETIDVFSKVKRDFEKIFCETYEDFVLKNDMPIPAMIADVARE